MKNFVLSQVTANAAAGSAINSFSSGVVAVNVACTVVFQYPIDSESNRVVLLNRYYQNITQQYSQSIQSGSFTQQLQQNAESQNVGVFTAAVATSIPDYGDPRAITVNPTVAPTLTPQTVVSNEASQLLSTTNAIIVGCVVGIVGLGLLAVVAFYAYRRLTNNKTLTNVDLKSEKDGQTLDLSKRNGGVNQSATGELVESRL